VTHGPSDGGFFERWSSLPVERTDDAMRIGAWPVMYAWERPLMELFARELCGPAADLLEIGFGMGVFAEAAAARGAKSHTIIEPHPALVPEARAFCRRQGRHARVVAGYWQEVLGELGRYDAIFYDSYSPDATLLSDMDGFFALAAERLLRPGGSLGFWVPGPVLDDAVQRIAFDHFDSVSLLAIRGLQPTPECTARGFGPVMLAPIARLPIGAGGARP
jgi:guanidinoacetate N-methyltransferase